MLVEAISLSTVGEPHPHSIRVILARVVPSPKLQLPCSADLWSAGLVASEQGLFDQG